MTPHDPYIMWLRRTKTPIARCRTCTWEKATASLPKAQRARDKHETTGR